MKKIFLVIKAEIEKQQKHDYHSAFVYLSLLIWPILGFLEVYYTYKPFSLTGYMGISDSKELLAFLGTGFMSYTCFWSMVQNAWSMANQERKGGTLEITFLSPANRLAMMYGRALGALIQEVWMQRMAEEGKICRIIVKDLSRFGREQVEAGRLTQIVYPSLGITFISIQENVNSTTGDGMEMLPFYNIFNEWYAAQTSKKIRAVWQSKAEHGKRVSATVPFGYMKSPDNKEQWIIDEPAANIVRKIYSLCLAGRGPLQIAKQLEKENILIPSAYYESIGKTHTQKVPCDSCKWDQKTVVNILENRQYTGCAVNFKSTTVSYKVHKVIHNPTEEYQIIPNMQEPIISEEQWLRVQELRKHRRRPTATGRQSLFSGLVYCPDCGAKLHFCAAKSLKRNQEFWRCSNYKSGRGECQIHYIRDISLEQIVLESIRSLADFVKCYESAFLYMLAKKTNLVRQTENKKLRLSVERGGKRISEIDKLIEKVFEQNAAGILSDERFSKLLQNYECEQKRLQTEIEEWKAALDDVGQKVTDLRLLLHSIMESLFFCIKTNQIKYVIMSLILC